MASNPANQRWQKRLQYEDFEMSAADPALKLLPAGSRASSTNKPQLPGQKSTSGKVLIWAGTGHFALR